MNIELWQVAVTIASVGFFAFLVYLIIVMRNLSKTMNKLNNVVELNTENINSIIENMDSITNNIDAITKDTTVMTNRITNFVSGYTSFSQEEKQKGNTSIAHTGKDVTKYVGYGRAIMKAYALYKNRKEHKQKQKENRNR